jgi:hypothetical protein
VPLSSGGLAPGPTDAWLLTASAVTPDAGAELSMAEIRPAQVAAPTCSGTGTITYQRTATYQFEKVTPTANGSITDYDRRSATTRVSVTLDADRADATVSVSSFDGAYQIHVRTPRVQPLRSAPRRWTRAAVPTRSSHNECETD